VWESDGINKGSHGDASFGARMESIQAMKRTRRILVARPGSRVDAYCYRICEKNDEDETMRNKWEANRGV
jgi:hypothetical protein